MKKCPICGNRAKTLRRKIISKGQSSLTWEEEAALEIFNCGFMDCTLEFCASCVHFFRLPLFDEGMAYGERGLEIKARVYQKKHTGQVYHGDCGSGPLRYRPSWAAECSHTFQHLANVMKNIGAPPMPVSGHLSVLDWGGGDGYLAEMTAMAANVVARTPVKGFCYDLAYSGESPYFTVLDRNQLWEHAPYDMILASHVLEHVPHPASLIQEMAGFLSTRGKIVIIVPYEQYRLFSPIGVGWQHHQHMFSRRSLARCIDSAGLAVDHASAFRSAHRGIPNWTIQATARHRNGLASGHKAGRLSEIPVFAAAALWASRQK